MFRPLTLLITTLSLATPAFASQSCQQADSSFGGFLRQFKNNASFRESRLLKPLPISATDPAGTTNVKLSLRQIRQRKMQIIIGDKRAAELKGTEGQLCEEVPVVQRDSVVLDQHSCDTDVYSNSFHFVRRNGCWMLLRVEYSGG